jgi:hypothetical protein
VIKEKVNEGNDGTLVEAGQNAAISSPRLFIRAPVRSEVVTSSDLHFLQCAKSIGPKVNENLSDKATLTRFVSASRRQPLLTPFSSPSCDGHVYYDTAGILVLSP